MKFTLSWLHDYLDTDAPLERIVDTLFAVGLEVEAVTDPSEALKPFTVAHVLKADQHPDADKLKVCLVDTGSGEPVQVVCGAPNARTGMKGVFAPPGAYVPGIDLTLKQARIRGIPSNGMLCSEREMMLSDEHTGIIELDDDALIGASFAEIAGLDDPVIEIAITPNRQDCLGVAGIARDLAAAGLGTLKLAAPEPVQGHYDSPIDVRLEFDADTADACPMFVGRLIRGVTNGPSPAWLQQRLKAIGLRPISALVDITNYVTYDRGRPLHVYDADKLNGHIRARLGTKGESFAALDGRSYTVKGGECVIADDRSVLGFGGIIGGEDSGCTEDTTNVFVECALFDPIRTAMTGRAHDLITDARYRFERGADPAYVIPGMAQATRLILDLVGGQPSRTVVAGAAPDWARTVAFRPDRVRSLGGVAVPAADCARILTALGFKVGTEADGAMPVAIPSWRRDVQGEADLVEEVLRINGYDAIPATPLPRDGVVAHATLTTLQRRARAVRRRLASEGLMEAVTYSFMDRRHVDLFGAGNTVLPVDNPISSELDAMRPSILPNLLTAAGRNMDRGAAVVRLFEVGPQYRDDSVDGQDLVATGVRTGHTGPRHWTAPPAAVDAFDAKADAIAALEAAGAPVASLQVFAEAPDWYHPGRSGTLRLGPKTVLAAFGELHPRVLAALDVDGPAVGFEVYLERVPVPKAAATVTRAALKLSNLPAVERDFAFVVDASVAAGDMLRAARGADKAHVKDVRVFDVYQGDGVPEGQKSVALAVRLEPAEKTFSDAEIEAIAGRIVAAVTKSTGGILRG